jgi:hypothetical protein
MVSPLGAQPAGTVRLRGVVRIGDHARGSGRHRLYVQDKAAGEVIGIDLPLAAADGHVTPGFGGQLPQELASIIRSGHIRVQPQLKPDEYCTAVYDLNAWVTRAPPEQTPGGPARTVHSIAIGRRECERIHEESPRTPPSGFGDESVLDRGR